MTTESGKQEYDYGAWDTKEDLIENVEHIMTKLGGAPWMQDLPKETRVLDYCGGTGVLARRIAKKYGFEIALKDTNERYMTIAGRNAAHDNVDHRITTEILKHKDGRELETESFDIIIANLALGTLDEGERGALIENLSRALVKDGHIIFTEFGSKSDEQELIEEENMGAEARTGDFKAGHQTFKHVPEDEKCIGKHKHSSIPHGHLEKELRGKGFSIGVKYDWDKPCHVYYLEATKEQTADFQPTNQAV